MYWRECVLTSSSRGSLVTLCMGRMRKEIMGRPPQSPLPSICFRVSLNTVLLVLVDEHTHTHGHTE